MSFRGSEVNHSCSQNSCPGHSRIESRGKNQKGEGAGAVCYVARMDRVKFRTGARSEIDGKVCFGREFVVTENYRRSDLIAAAVRIKGERESCHESNVVCVRRQQQQQRVHDFLMY